MASKSLSQVYFYEDIIIEGEKINIFRRSNHSKVKSWIFYVYTGTPTPSGRRVEVVHTTRTLTKSYWYFEFSGVKGDAVKAGIKYGTFCTKEPKNKEIPDYIFDVVIKLFKLPVNLIQRKEMPNAHELKDLMSNPFDKPE